VANEQVNQKKQGEVEVSPQQDQQENWKKWSKLVAQAWADEELKKRLLDKPASVLQEHGIQLPAGMEVRVVEPTDKLFYFVLPPKPADTSELTSSQLTGVAGGSDSLIVVNPITGTKLMEYGTIELSGGGSAACAFY
jgi:Nitrile hydratase, alpha chain